MSLYFNSTPSIIVTIFLLLLFTAFGGFIFRDDGRLNVPLLFLSMIGLTFMGIFYMS